MTYRYPVVYRIQALFGALLASMILLGSVIAEIEAADFPDALLYAFGFVVGLSILLLGLDFGTRAITPTPQGLRVRWVRASLIPWNNVLGWRYRPLGLIHIRLRRGLGLYIWPLLERYTELLDAIDKHRGDAAHA
jgi:hypothetical protein